MTTKLILLCRVVTYFIAYFVLHYPTRDLHIRLAMPVEQGVAVFKNTQKY